MSQAGVELRLDRQALSGLVSEIVREALAQVDSAKHKVNGRLAYSEAEAADLLGLRQHQLRDLRLAGEIEGARYPNGRVFYRRETLIEFLIEAERREKTGDCVRTPVRRKKTPRR